MFFIGDLDIERLMENTELVYVPVYTNNKEWTWPCCMLSSNLQNSNEIDFGFYPIDGQHCDSGSAMYCYLQKYKPKVKHFERNAILDEQNELLEFLDFPHPYSIDYLKFDNKPIVFHYKTSSNYAPHCTSEYNKKKTIALKKLLKYYNGND